MKTHQANALYLARFLEAHPAVSRVYYPGLPAHRNHQLARRQMSGFSGMISFLINGDRRRVERFLGGLELFTLAESLGAVESLVSCPAAMTHQSMPAGERRRRGLGDNLVRLSVGIENKLDLKDDLARALACTDIDSKS